MTPPAHTYHDTGVARAEAMDGRWRAEAACKDEPTQVFFPPQYNSENDAARAKAICKGCPVRYECLEYALVANIGYGIWGGMGEQERRKEKRRRKIRVEPDRDSKLQPCGTRAAYDRHLRRKEPIDDACREANRLYQAEKMAKKREAS